MNFKTLGINKAKMPHLSDSIGYNKLIDFPRTFCETDYSLPVEVLSHVILSYDTGKLCQGKK